MITRRAIVAFPETTALAAIESLRRELDPQASFIAAHLTLVFPFVHEGVPHDLGAHIEQAMDGLGSIVLTLSEVTVVDSEYVFLEVGAAREQIVELHERLYSGNLARHRSREHVYRPHVTIARSADAIVRARAVARAHEEIGLPVAATIRDVAMFRIDGPSAGEIELRVPLGRRGQRP